MQGLQLHLKIEPAARDGSNRQSNQLRVCTSGALLIKAAQHKVPLFCSRAEILTVSKNNIHLAFFIVSCRIILACPRPRFPASARRFLKTAAATLRTTCRWKLARASRERAPASRDFVEVSAIPCAALACGAVCAASPSGRSSPKAWLGSVTRD